MYRYNCNRKRNKWPILWNWKKNNESFSLELYPKQQCIETKPYRFIHMFVHCIWLCIFYCVFHSSFITPFAHSLVHCSAFQVNKTLLNDKLNTNANCLSPESHSAATGATGTTKTTTTTTNSFKSTKNNNCGKQWAISNLFRFIKYLKQFINV